MGDNQVLNSPNTSRELARRLLASQAIAALVVALVCLPFGGRAAIAALAGGLLIVVATALMAARALAPGPAGAGLARLAVGLVLRWIVVLGGLFVVLVGLKWPPAPVIAGLAAALLVPMVRFIRGS